MKFLPGGAALVVLSFSADDGDVAFGCPGSDSIGGGAGEDVDEVEAVV